MSTVASVPISWAGQHYVKKMVSPGGISTTGDINKCKIRGGQGQNQTENWNAAEYKKTNRQTEIRSLGTSKVKLK